jgi:hypothetical protein
LATQPQCELLVVRSVEQATYYVGFFQIRQTKTALTT